MHKGSNEFEFVTGTINSPDNKTTIPVHKIEVLKHFNTNKPQLVTMSKYFKEYDDSQQDEIYNYLVKMFNDKTEFILNGIDEKGESKSFKCIIDEKPEEKLGIIYAFIVEKL